jgi:carbonic anhydrase
VGTERAFTFLSIICDPHPFDTGSNAKPKSPEMRLHHYLLTTINFLCVRLISSFGTSATSRRGIDKATGSTLFPPPHTHMSWTSSRTFAKVTGEDPDIEKLFQANRAWVDAVNKDGPEYFQKLGSGQSPKFLYIGCSDARVAVSKLTGTNPGELFVHRNIANMVVSSDLNLLAVLTYAVEQLNVKHILVTGHYDCGGIRAAVKKQDFGQVLDAWLQNIRDVYRLHKEELDSIEDDEDRHRRLVELNVLEQCLNLYKTSVVQRKRLETYSDPNKTFTYPRIHGLVFDPSVSCWLLLGHTYPLSILALSRLSVIALLQRRES